ncbi:MAG: AAA family ATPase [Phycisphaerae bacterium]
MSNLLHVCLYNTDPGATQELGDAIRVLNFVRLVAEVGTPEELATALQEAKVNLVFFHLDPESEPVVEVIDQVSTRYPELALIAISHQTDPQAILAPMRVGCDQFVCEPIDPSDLATAVGRVVSKRLLSQPKSRCICITGASGGAGTTSIACNLALEIGHLTDRDCALVDLDLQFGDVALNFDNEPKYTLYDLAITGTDLDDTILTSTLTTLPCKVALLSRPEMIEQQEAVTPDTIHRVVELLMANYENVVIDVPRHMNPTTAAVLSHADLVVIVCQLLVPSIRNAKRYFDALLQTGVLGERLEIVVNRSDGRSSGRITVKDIEDTTKKPVYACIPNDYQFVARSIDFGRPIAALDRNSPVRAAIRKMARRITSESGAEPQKEGDRRGFFRRLLTK